MNTGSTYLAMNPYAADFSARGHLGDAEVEYGTEARYAALQRAQQDRLNRIQDQEDAAQRASERERVLDMAQDAVERASLSQRNILTSGQNQLQRFLRSGGTIAALSLATLAAVAIFGRGSGSESRSRSRSAFPSRSVRSKPSWRPGWKRRRIKKTIALSEGIL
jgi:hypothetical protein